MVRVNPHRPSLMPEIERSANLAEKDLDKVYRDLANKGKVPRKAPRTHHDRNMAIYGALGFIPLR